MPNYNLENDEAEAVAVADKVREILKQSNANMAVSVASLGLALTRILRESAGEIDAVTIVRSVEACLSSVPGSAMPMRNLMAPMTMDEMMSASSEVLSEVHRQSLLPSDQIYMAKNLLSTIIAGYEMAAKSDLDRDALLSDLGEMVDFKKRSYAQMKTGMH